MQADVDMKMKECDELDSARSTARVCFSNPGSLDFPLDVCRTLMCHLPPACTERSLHRLVLRLSTLGPGQVDSLERPLRIQLASGDNVSLSCYLGD
jgi:hypothetical protein